MLLPLAATARDMYAAPALLGASLLIALWASGCQRLGSAPRGALRRMRWTVALAGSVFAALAIAVAVV
ncbi:MAG: hypothetical protein ACP5P4_05900 [Steroidobacteraceae bacterium]